MGQECIMYSIPETEILIQTSRSKEGGYIFSLEYWEMENRFLKASKPKSSYLLSYIKGGAFCTSHLTLLYIFCLSCLLTSV